MLDINSLIENRESKIHLLNKGNKKFSIKIMKFDMSYQKLYHLYILGYEKSEALCREYASAKGLGTFARPANHLFFRKLGPVLKRTLEKCERENGMM